MFLLQCYLVLFILISCKIYKFIDCFLFFGSVYITRFNLHILVLLLILLICVCYVCFVWYFTSIVNLFDFFITINFLFFFSWLLWCCTNIYSFIFIFDILNLLIYLLLILKLNIIYTKNFYQTNIFFLFIQGFSIFFWVSFCATIIFFIFIFYFYINIFTFDFFFYNILYSTIFNQVSLQQYVKQTLSLVLLLFFFFLKSGVAPLFIWKPAFFKLLNKAVLCFYIFFYYTNIIFFFLYCLVYYFNFLFMYLKVIVYILLFLVVYTAIRLFKQINDVFTFYAFSSLINTTLIIFLLFSCCFNISATSLSIFI